ncbi:MAG TPA: SRPBCC domain-containing protein [Bryobacteraceae bacterium]|nr:SRPBCC domain-containing protein [Bryobacteraceae bacterium]
MNKSEVRIDGRRLQITRVFNAPREVVFEWWSKAENLSQWSGCKETTQCEVEMDFRPGGSFTQKMQIEGAGAFTLRGFYDEIVVPERISYRADMGQAVTRVTIEFFEQGGKTKVVLTQDGFPDETLPKIVSQGTSESLEKLDTLVAARALAESR